MKLQINQDASEKLISLRAQSDKSITQLMYEAIEDLLNKYNNKGVLHDSQRTDDSTR